MIGDGNTLIRAVVFDFGQTLVDSADGFRTAGKETQRKACAAFGSEAVGMHPVWLQHRLVQRRWPVVETSAPVIDSLESLLGIELLVSREEKWRKGDHPPRRLDAELFKILQKGGHGPDELDC